MPDPIAAVIKKMLSVTAITDLVGQRIAVFGDHASTSAAGLPYITVQQIDGDDLDHIDGHAGVATAELQVNCVGGTYASARAVMNAGLAAWRAVTRESVSITGDTVHILGATTNSHGDRPRPPAAGRDAPRYIAGFDISIHLRTD